jgi:hypothetical protein
MTSIVSAARNTGRWFVNLVDSIRHGEEDLRTLYGDHPNGAKSPEQTMLEASVAHNIGNLGNGGLG